MAQPDSSARPAHLTAKIHFPFSSGQGEHASDKFYISQATKKRGFLKFEVNKSRFYSGAFRRERPLCVAE